MSYDLLNSLDLKSLQERLNRNGPKLVAAGFPALKAPQVAIFIRVYLYEYENLYTKKSINVIKEFRFNKSDPIERNSVKYKWLIGGKLMPIGQIKRMVEEFNVPHKYINDEFLTIALYEYLYKAGFTLPQYAWYSYDILSSPKNIYDIIEENWQTITPYEITRDELMQIVWRSYDSFSNKDLLVYQTTENIYAFLQAYLQQNMVENGRWKDIIADLSPDEYMTKRFLINYLTSDGRIISEIFIKGFFGDVNDPTGQRRQLIERYLASNFTTKIFRSPVNNLLTIAAYPPYWFEEEWLINGAPNLTPIDLQNLIEKLIQEPVVNSSFDKLPSLLYLPAYPVAERLPTHNELGEMIRQKDPRLKFFSKDVVLRSAGFKGAARYENDSSCNNLNLINKIKEGFEKERFEIYTKFDMCKSDPGIHPVDNIYMEEYSGFLIAYGSYFNLDCMSINDLIASFVTREINGVVIEVSFRKPYSMSLFTAQQIKGLQTLLIDQPADFTPDFDEQRTKLLGIISIGLKNTLTIERVIEILDQYVKMSQEGNSTASQNIEKFKQMLTHLFNAGMYQRTWQGPGNPYPHTAEEADVNQVKVNSQACIDIVMAPELSAFLEDFNGLETTFQSLVANFPAIYNVKISPYEVSPYGQSMVNMVEQIIGLRDDSGELLEEPSYQGNMCVGGVSKMMIYSAYVYLKVLGFDIEGFDIKRFYPESGHRMR